MRVHHIAYAVSDVSAAARSFAALGFEPEGSVCVDQKRGVEIQFLLNAGGTRIELVAPAREDSPVSEMLRKGHGTGSPYHICYEVESIADAQQGLARAGFVPTSDMAPAPAISGRNVSFAFSRAVGLIELVEVDQDESL